MAYDEALAARVRAAFGTTADIEERRMFGGLAFMLGGHMCCGVAGDELVLRLGAPRAATAVGHPHVRYCDFTGRPMKTMVTVAPDGLADEEVLTERVRQALDFARTQPPKT